MSNDYELLEKLHCLVQEVVAMKYLEGEELPPEIEQMYSIIEQLREKNPQAPWNKKQEG